MQSHTIEKTGSSGRTIAFRVLTGLFAIGSLIGLFGIGLIVGWIDTEEGKIHRVHDIGFGVLAGAIMTVGFLAQLRHPERKVSALYQVVAAGVAGLIGGLMASDVSFGMFFLVLAVLSVGILLLLHPARAELRRQRARVSSVLAGLAALGAIPLVWLALTMARFQRDGLPTDPHVKESHWTLMAAMAIAIVLVAFLASARLPGWRITAWSAGAGAFFYGLASAVFATFPGTDSPYAGSKGTGWGIVAMAGGLLFIAVAEWEVRKPGAEAG